MSNNLSGTAISRTGQVPYGGRLLILDSSTDLDASQSTSEISAIYFPSLPDSIDLTRSAEYYAQSNWAMPDGVHMYKSTAVMCIPFSFRLSAYDENFCPNGPLTLLAVAARLQSCIVPIGSSSSFATASSSGYGGNSEQSQNSPTNNTPSTDVADPSANLSNVQKLDPPVTVRLELMSTGSGGPGIACNGYLKDIKTSLLGPYLTGPDSSYNLPSAGDFGFTFVFHPSHGNNYSGGQMGSTVEQQALADYIRVNLFNQTGSLGNYNTSAWRGFGTTQ